MKSKKKIALITGITGQTGSYLAEFLLKKNYIVHGIIRRTSLINTHRINNIFRNKNLKLHYGDLSDPLNLDNLIRTIKPTEIYNLAAQSHVAVSFKLPEYTTNINALGCLRILEIIKRFNSKIKFYQASTSELYGLTMTKKQNEKTVFYPQSPYAISNLYAYWITKHYRESYKIFACNGILFNHESPRRGETFVTRKITIGLAKIVLGIEKKLELGNLESLRDWGHAKDYVEGMWMILNHHTPDDWVLATGHAISVREFVEIVFNELDLKIKWDGKDLNEVGTDQNGDIRVAVDPRYFRPTEVPHLLGDAEKARTKLNWKPKYNLETLIKEMVSSEIALQK
jgi:GDPmannose 4,6-dehydratase